MDNSQSITTLKGKTHIIDKRFKVNGFMKTVNHKLQIEVGTGNNPDDISIDNEISYIKLSNRGDLDIRVRLSKNGKESKTISLGPADTYNGITIFFAGREAAAYLREAHEYVDYMINDFYDIPRLKNPDYTNDESRFAEVENQIIDKSKEVNYFRKRRYGL